MERNLSPKWKLSTDHAASSYGIPVLVDGASGAAYGPGDVAALLHALPRRDGRRLLDALLRLADDPEGRELIENFLAEGGAPDEDQTE